MSTNQPLGNMIIEVGLDSTTFASGMKGVKQQVTAASKEMKAHLDIIGKSGKEVDKLKVQQDGLAKVIDAQSKKVQKAKEEYDKCNATVGDGTKATQGQKDALIASRNEYNKAVGELGAYQNRLKDINKELDGLASKDAIIRLNEQIHASSVEMKANLSVLGESGREVDKLRVKQVGYTSIINTQSEKVRIAKEELDAHRKSMEESGDATQDQKDKLLQLTNEYNEARGELGSYGNELKETTIQLDAMESSTYKTGEALEAFGKKASSFGKGIEEIGNGIASIGGAITKAVTLPLTVMGAGLIKSGVEVQKFRQQAGLFYESLYQDSKRAQDQLDALLTFAKSTPYSYESIVEADKIMQTFGMSTERTSSVLKSLTETIAGTGGSSNDLSKLATVMGQIESSGKLSLQDMNQLVNASIPAFKIVANELGISVKDLRREISAGKITSEEAITALTDGLLRGTDGINGATVAYEGSLAKVKNILPGAIDSFKSALKNQFSLELINDENFAKITQAINKFTEMLNSGAFDVLTKTVSNAIAGLVDNVIKAVEWFNDLSGSQQQFLLKMVGITAVAGPVIAIFGKLTTGVGKFVGKIGDLSTGIANYMKKQALSTAAKQYDAAATTAQTLATSTQAGAEKVAAAAKQATTTATGAATVAAGANTAAVTAQKVATDAAAVSASKLQIALGAIGIAITVATAIIVPLVSHFKNLGTATTDAKKNIDEINNAFNDSVASAEANAIAAGRLVDQLEALEGQGLKTNTEQLRYKAIIEELKTLMPDLNLEINEQTGLLRDGTDALKNNIAELKNYYIEQALIKKNTDLYIKLADATIELGNAEYDLGEVQKKKKGILRELSKQTGISTDKIEGYTDAARGGSDALLSYLAFNEDTTAAMSNQSEVVRILTKDEKGLVEELGQVSSKEYELTNKVKGGEKAVASYDAQIDDAGRGLKEHGVIVDETSDKISNMGDDISGTVDSLKDSFDTLTDSQKEALGELVDAYKTMSDGLSSVSDEIKLNDEKTWETVQKNQADTIAKTQTFADLYSQLINAGVSEAYLNAIGATGPEATPLLEGMLNDGISAVLEKQSEWEDAYNTILSDSLPSGLSGDARYAIKEYVRGETGIQGALKEAFDDADFNSLMGGSIEKAWRPPIDGLKAQTLNTITSMWDGTSNKFTSSISNVNTSVKGFAARQMAEFNTLKTSLNKTTGSMWTDIKSEYASGISNLNTKISNLPIHLANSLRGSGSALKTGLVSMWETAVKGSAAPVNKVIAGANWILTQFGSNQKVADWSPYAKGTAGHPGGNALVNDGRGAELVQMPGGETFIPQGRNVLIPNAPKGMKVLPAEETAQLMGRATPTYRYAGGIGDMLNNVFDSVKSAAARVKDFTLGIWDYVDSPGKLVDKVLDHFVNYTGVSGIAKTIGSSMVSMSEKAMETWTEKLFGESGGMGISGYIPTKGVEQWRSTVNKALQMENLFSAANVTRTLFQMKTESGGNPRAINLWDSNAKRGTPSKGLMQVIDPTFRAYARPGFNKDIWDPISNILASLRYAMSRYGSLEKAYRGVGYENGGFVATEQKAWLAEGNKLEMVVPLTNKSRALTLIAQALDYLGASKQTQATGTSGDSEVAGLLKQTVEQNSKIIALLQALAEKELIVDKNSVADVLDAELGRRRRNEARGFA